MKRYAKPNLSPEKSKEAATPVSSPGESLDVLSLLDRATTILQREIFNLMAESSSGKLSPTSSKSLVDYIKLLHGIKKEQADIVASLSNDEIVELLKD